MTDTDTNATVISTTLSTAQSLKIKWTVPDYFQLPESSDCSLDSPSFNFANATWRLRIHTEDLCEPTFSIVRLNSLLSRHKIIYRLGIVDKKEYDFGDYDEISCKRNGESRKVYFSGEEHESLKELKEENATDSCVTLLWHLLCEASESENAFSRKESHKRDRGKTYKMNEARNTGTIFLESTKARSLKIKWKIPDYFSLPDTSFDYSLSSPTFSLADLVCYLRLYPNGTTEGDLRTKISLVKIHSLLPCHDIIALCDIDIRVEDDDDDIPSYYEECPLIANDEWDFFKFPMGYLHGVQSDIAPDGAITVLGHFYYEESSEEDANGRKMQSEYDSCKIVCQDLKNLLLNGQDADLTLKVKDKEFRAHRSILRARSQIFESMLAHDMTEKNSGVVDIPDCDPQAMEQFLLYVYCGQVDALNEENMLNLYYTADKYEMMSLKQICCDFIQNSLSCKNITEVVQLALDHNDKSLLKQAAEFFVNNTREILITTEWLSFLKDNEVAANELFILASMEWTGAKTKKRRKRGKKKKNVNIK